jgi:ribonucleoside-diphosphate reductase alpha chain
MPSGKDADKPMVATRMSLPATRESLTHKFSIGGHEGYLTIGLHEDGRPGEVFLKISKEGSTISGLCQAYCRAFSLALQYGLPLEEAVRRFKGMRFEPFGMTSNPDVPDASSLIDYIARYLEVEFIERAGSRV